MWTSLGVRILEVLLAGASLCVCGALGLGLIAIGPAWLIALWNEWAGLVALLVLFLPGAWAAFAAFTWSRVLWVRHVRGGQTTYRELWDQSDSAM